MTAPTIRIAIAQINPTVGDFDTNLDKIARSLDAAKDRAAGLVVFPELAVTGYPPEDLLLRESFVAQNLGMLRRIAPHTKRLAAIVGFVDRDEKGKLYNAAACFYNGKCVGKYRKACLPNYGVFDERRYFESGRGILALCAGSYRIFVTICEDIWDP